MKFSLSRKKVEASGSKELMHLIDDTVQTDLIDLDLPNEEELNQRFAGKFSAEELKAKLRKYARTIGREGVKNALLLYYALQSKELSTRHKAIIIGSLGYLISVIDVVPDLTPLLGYSDDFALLAAAVTALVTAIDDETRQKAERQTQKLFGEQTGDS